MWNETLTDPISLRAIIRTTLASCPPSTANTFTAAARKRLMQMHARSRPSNSLLLFQTLDNGLAVPTQSLETILRRSRAFYGAGMGLASLGVLTEVVKSTLGLHWDLDGTTADVLAAVDADISQAIQSSKEELGGGRVSDLSTARLVVRDLTVAVSESLRDCERWGGEFPFERALASVEYWKF